MAQELYGGFVRVSPKNPCPICDHDSLCSVTGDGSRVVCGRVQEGSYQTKKTALGEMYWHRLTDEPREIPFAPRTKAEPPQRNVIADRAVFASVIAAGQDLPDIAMAELSRRFGPDHGPWIAERFGLAYCDGSAMVVKLEGEGRRREAIAAGVLWRNGKISPALDGHLLIPYTLRGVVHDFRTSGIKGRAETKEVSLPGGYAEREVDGIFFGHDALDNLPEDGMVHMAGGAWKTMALVRAGLCAIGTRGEAELFDAQLAALREAGVRRVILHIDAEDPKPGQDLSAGRRLGLAKAEKLAAAGFDVAIAEPPREPGTAKVDPDALLRDQGIRAVRAYALSPVPLAAWRVVIGIDAPVAKELLSRIERLEADNRSLYALGAASAQLDRNKYFKKEKPTIKATVYEYASKQSRGEVDAEGWARTSRAALADASGASEDTVGTHLAEVDGWGVGIRRQVREEEHRRVDEHGQILVERRKALYIKVDGRPADVLMALGGDFQPPRPVDKATGKQKDTWGGKRTPCPRCGSQRRRTVVTCADCDLEFSNTVCEPPQDPAEETLADITPRAEEPASIPPAPVIVPAPTPTYPSGEVTYHADAAGPVKVDERDDMEDEPDTWDPNFCNHPGCANRPVIGQRYCGEHRRTRATVGAAMLPDRAYPPASASILDPELIDSEARRNGPEAIAARLAKLRARWDAGERTSDLGGLLADWAAIAACRATLDRVVRA